MAARSKKSKPATLTDTSGAASSTASEGGSKQPELLAFQQLDLFGSPASPASPTAPPAGRKPKKIRATSGPVSIGSSASADLQRFLVNRLMQQLDSTGSIEFSLTWKRKATPAGAGKAVPVADDAGGRRKQRQLAGVMEGTGGDEREPSTPRRQDRDLLSGGSVNRSATVPVAHDEAERRRQRTEDSGGGDEGIRADARGGGSADDRATGTVGDTLRRDGQPQCLQRDSGQDAGQRTPLGADADGSDSATVGDAQGVTDSTGPQGLSLRTGGRAGERPVGQTGGDAGGGVANSRSEHLQSVVGCVVSGNAASDSLIDAPIGSGRPDGVGFWDDYRIIPCRDGKARRVPTEPSFQPLADGLRRDLGPFLAWMERMGYDPKAARALLRANGKNRTGRLKGYGNAIVAPLAATFIKAFLEAEADLSRQGE